MRISNKKLGQFNCHSGHDAMSENLNCMSPTKSEQFANIFATHRQPTTKRGRKPSPLSKGPDGQTRFPSSREAYIRRLQHFKALIAIDHGSPCIDPIAETKNHICSVRRALWLYMYECLPVFPAKEQGLANLMATNNANLLMQGLEEIILGRLSEEMISDSEFADRVLDNTRMIAFATRWFGRKKGHRAL